MARADEFERYMLELINADRALYGAPPLQLEQRLNDSAAAHSLWMLNEDIFSHTGVDGSSPTQRMRDANFDLSGGWRTAENIAVQSERGPDGIMDDVANLHTSLMNSPGHRANLLNPDLDYIGIGIELGEFDFSSGTYTSVIVTQNFASTGGSVVLDAEPAPAPPVAQTFGVEQADVTVAEPEVAEPEAAPVDPAPSAPVSQADDPVDAEPSPTPPSGATPAVPDVIAVSPPAEPFGGLDDEIYRMFRVNDGPQENGSSPTAALADLTAALCRDVVNDFQAQMEAAADDGLAV